MLRDKFYEISTWRELRDNVDDRTSLCWRVKQNQKEEALKIRSVVQFPSEIKDCLLYEDDNIRVYIIRSTYKNELKLYVEVLSRYEIQSNAISSWEFNRV